MIKQLKPATVLVYISDYVRDSRRRRLHVFEVFGILSGASSPPRCKPDKPEHTCSGKGDAKPLHHSYFRINI